MTQFLWHAHVIERDIRLVRQRVKVRKIREFRRTNDRNAQLPIGGGLIAIVLLVEGDGVLLIDAERVDVRDDPKDGLSRLFFQKVKGGRQEAHVTAKLVDDKALDERTLLRVEQFQRPHKGGKRTAAVDVSDQEDGRAKMLCHAHIDDIVCLEIDLGGAARALDHEQIIRGTQAIQRHLNGLPCLERIACVVLPRTHIADRFPHDDNL